MRPATLALSLTLPFLLVANAARAGDKPPVQQAQAEVRVALKQAPKTGVAKFMRAKLASSQNILAGLVTEEYKLIITGAEELKVMSRATEWQVFRDPTYERHSDSFRRAADDMIKQAKAENIDGVTLGYVRVTMSCINCHNYVRSVRTVKLGNRATLKHVAELVRRPNAATDSP